VLRDFVGCKGFRAGSVEVAAGSVKASKLNARLGFGSYMAPGMYGT
jgi:hypothetical protein